MPYSPVPDATTVRERNQYVCGWVMELRRQSEQYHWEYRKRCPRIYDLYRGIRTNRYHVHKNSISVPLLYTIIWSQAARIMNMVFGQNPAIRFSGSGDLPDEAKIARKHDNLFNAQFRDANGIAKALDVMVNANLYGTSIVQHGWKYEKGRILVPDVATAPLSETTVQVLTEKNVVNFDGPTFELIDNLDAFPQPGHKRIADMRWFIRRYWLDFTQCEALTHADGTREPIFDKDEVRRCQAEGGGAISAFDSLKAQRGISMYAESEDTARQREKYARPVEITEAVGIHVPQEFAYSGSKHDGMTFRVITVANGRYLFRNKPFPFMLNRKPYLEMSFNPDPHFFFAPGRGEMAEKLQLGINKFTNQTLDALDVAIDPWFVFDRAANIDPRNLFLRPGRWIPVDGNPGERIMPGQVNMQGMQAGIETTQLLWQYMQRASGILDESVIGIRAPGRSTARGDLSRAESVAVRLVLEALMFEQQFFEPLADSFMAHNKQFLETPREFLILGESAAIDPVYQSPIPKGRDIMLPGDMLPTYAARALGTQTRMIRSGRTQDLLLATQVLSSSPQAAAALDWIAWNRLIGRELGLGAEMNEAITKYPEAARLLAASGGNMQNVPGLNILEGQPGGVGNLNPLAELAGAF